MAAVRKLQRNQILRHCKVYVVTDETVRLFDNIDEYFASDMLSLSPLHMYLSNDVFNLETLYILVKYICAHPSFQNPGQAEVFFNDVQDDHSSPDSLMDIFKANKFTDIIKLVTDYLEKVKKAAGKPEKVTQETAAENGFSGAGDGAGGGGDEDEGSAAAGADAAAEGFDADGGDFDNAWEDVTADESPLLGESQLRELNTLLSRIWFCVAYTKSHWISQIPDKVAEIMLSHHDAPGKLRFLFSLGIVKGNEWYRASQYNGILSAIREGNLQEGNHLEQAQFIITKLKENLAINALLERIPAENEQTRAFVRLVKEIFSRYGNLRHSRTKDKVLSICDSDQVSQFILLDLMSYAKSAGGRVYRNDGIRLTLLSLIELAEGTSTIEGVMTELCSESVIKEILKTPPLGFQPTWNQSTRYLYMITKDGFDSAGHRFWRSLQDAATLRAGTIPSDFELGGGGDQDSDESDLNGGQAAAVSKASGSPR
jgi:hypothetical protein